MNRFSTVSLTEKTDDAEGRGGEGKFYAAYSQSLSQKYPEFLPYLSSNELAVFDEGLTFYKWESPRDRAMKCMRWSDVIDKLPSDVLESHYQRLRDDYKIKTIKLKQSRKHGSHELGAREFTLTYSPTWFSDAEARLQMQRAIERLSRYYKDGDQRIIKLRAIGEVGSNGLSHVHCFYQLLGGVKISDKNFKRAYPPWEPKVKQGPSGHKGGHHANVRHIADFLGYIEKEVADAWLDVKIE